MSNHMDITSIEARFRAAGTLSDGDIRHLIFELKHRPTAQEVITQYKAAGEEFDRLTSEGVAK